MKKLRRLPALLCALAILCALALPAWGSSNTVVYLLALNDKFYDSYLPVAVNGVIYIPYSTFDRTATGVDLGVYYGITPEQGTILTLYSMRGTLTFKMGASTCEDNLGNVKDFHALNRNGIPYVPASAVCGFFGLQYSFLPTTDRGTLIRITSSSTAMKDGVFLDSSRGYMTRRYNQIIQSQELQPSNTAAPSSSPAATPAPSPSSPSGGKDNVRVYLAVEVTGANQDLTGLFSGSSNVHALFLFPPDVLPAQAAAVRRIVAAGHSVGLLVDGSEEEARAQLERGNQLLTHIARIRTRVVSAPAGLIPGLTAEGWRCWQANVSGGDSRTILSSLDAKRSVGYVTLPANSGVASRVLSQIRTDSYDLRRPLETEL